MMFLQYSCINAIRVVKNGKVISVVPYVEIRKCRRSFDEAAYWEPKKFCLVYLITSIKKESASHF